MKKTFWILLLSLVIITTFPNTASAASTEEIVNKITASDAAAMDYFGYSVATSGNKLIVGAYQDDDKGNGSGSAYVYDLSYGTGSLADVLASEIKITARDGAANDRFGYSVAISGDKVAISANYDDNECGAVYIYDLSNGSGSASDVISSEKKLTASDRAEDDYFGNSIGLSGDTLIIGAHGDDDKGTNSGAVYVYNLSNGSGSTSDILASEKKLTASDGGNYSSYGNAVAISENTALIGARADDTQGSAYVYNLSNGSGSASDIIASERKIIANDIASGDAFGTYVDISGNIVVVGSPMDDDAGNYSGSAYVYDLSNGNGSASDIIASEKKLTASDAGESMLYGNSVGISSDIVVIGSTSATGKVFGSGSAYVYDLSATNILDSEIKIFASDGAISNSFGYSMAFVGDNIVIGAKTSDNGYSSGSVYYQSAKELLGTTINFNDNGGSGGQTTAKATYESAMPTPITLPTRTGYVFNGYYDASSGGTQYYTSEGASARTWDKEDATATLYAQWTAKSTTISYQDNGGSGGQSATTTAVYDGAMSTPITLPTKTGYNFAGYYDAASGGNQYYTSSGASARTWDKEGATFNLYAQWTAKETTLSYQDNGGSGGQSATTTAVYDSDMPTPITLPTRIGYAFTGYYDAATDGTQYYTSSGASTKVWDKEDSTATLYAQWLQIIYTITYDSNGGIGTEPNATGVYDETITLSDGAGFSKVGFVLDKWDIGGLSGLYTISGNVTAHADWIGDSDGDGVSDDEEDGAGSDKNDPDDTPKEGTIKVTALNNDGSAASGIFVLNSTPQTQTTDVDGSVVFTGVSLTTHTLSFRNGTTEYGNYTLQFITDRKNSTVIQDDASTDSIGATITTYNSRFLTLELTIQLNGSNEWQIMAIDYTGRNIVDNPKTGEY